jgi:hypothetical protein
MNEHFRFPCWLSILLAALHTDPIFLLNPNSEPDLRQYSVQIVGKVLNNVAKISVQVFIHIPP